MIDMVAEMNKVTGQFDRGLITASECIQELNDIAKRKGDEVRRTYTYMALTDGKVNLHMEDFTFHDVAESERCYDCEHSEGECPTDKFLEELNLFGKAMRVDGPYGVEIVTICYVNQ
jgi:hypothetical protein